MGGRASLRLRSRHREGIILLVLLTLGLVFFLANANRQLAHDDLGWLRGQPPTVFDRYRLVPQLLFTTLHGALGPSAPAALAMVFAFHCLNGLMVHGLAKRLLGDVAAGLAAAAVFVINPITLGTLTWISCFSYVIGTSLALASLLCVHKANLPGSRYPVLWLALALSGFAAALLSSHVTLFLPVLFLVLCVLQSRVWRGVILFSLGTAMALLVSLLLYSFGDYGVEGARLASLDFVLAWTSSVLSSGSGLFLAHPLSFVTRVQDLLRFCLTEPVRWALTVGAVAAGLLLCRSRRGTHLAVALAVSYGALITPYIIRLYLTPDSVNYHISYVLSGRVFYLPFTVIALAWGAAVARIVPYARGRRWSWLLVLLPSLAYACALWVYGPGDFLGLNVTRDLEGPVAARWNPYEQQEPLWLLVTLAVVGCLFLVRSVVGRRPAESDGSTGRRGGSQSGRA